MNTTVEWSFFQRHCVSEDKRKSWLPAYLSTKEKFCFPSYVGGFQGKFMCKKCAEWQMLSIAMRWDIYQYLELWLHLINQFFEVLSVLRVFFLLTSKASRPDRKSARANELYLPWSEPQGAKSWNFWLDRGKENDLVHSSPVVSGYSAVCAMPIVGV